MVKYIKIFLSVFFVFVSATCFLISDKYFSIVSARWDGDYGVYIYRSNDEYEVTLNVYKGRFWLMTGISCYSKKINGENIDNADDWEIISVTRTNIQLKHDDYLMKVDYSCN